MNGYRKLCTEFYDIDKPAAPQDALDFYACYAAESPGPILEPMCGTGRFLVPLLERGFEVDGMDASPQMLAACREKCAARGLKSTLREQWLHQLEMPRQYGLVFIASGSFSLVSNLDHVRHALRRVHDHMLSGAKFVFEIIQRRSNESSSWPWGGRWIQRPDGARIILSWLGRYDAAEHLQHDIHRYELVKDGQLLATEIEAPELRHYDLTEIRQLLETGGFVQIRALKTYLQRPPDDSDDEIVIECTRS